ncbi:tyrosine-type recombinase/integrase [Sphingosinicella sp. CPCC 101087]|uniref:tyrosine-type recombinase/integrase n=1 Tax=Sphingosinicella sp. CPCC 101087 TaxID=2497754 RepID=UPI00352B38AD
MEVRRRREREIRAQEQETFQVVGEEWLNRLKAQGRAESTLKKMRWLLGFAFPLLGSRPIAQITALEVLEVLRKMEARRRYETAVRLRSTFGTVFRYAIATGRAQRDVSVDLRGALIQPNVTHRPALLDPREIGPLLRAIDGYEGQPTVQIALRLAPHLFARPGELRMAEWREFDVDDAVWTIPAHKTKMRRPHHVPLSRQVLAMLAELMPVSGSTAFLFPGVRSEKRPITGNTLNAALRRLGYGKTQLTAHGFRAMAGTLLNEMGRWHPDAIERQLGHVEGNDVRRAYVRGEHWNERVRTMQAWSDYLDDLRKRVTGKPSDIRRIAPAMAAARDRLGSAQGESIDADLGLLTIYSRPSLDR